MDASIELYKAHMGETMAHGNEQWFNKGDQEVMGRVDQMIH